LDVRFKGMDFPMRGEWMNGKLTKEKALSFLKTAWVPFKPKACAGKAVMQPTTTKESTQSKGKVSFDAFMSLAQVCFGDLYSITIFIKGV